MTGPNSKTKLNSSERISRFLRNANKGKKKIEELSDKIDKGNPIDTVLKEYFGECIEIHHEEKQLTLHFDIFADTEEDENGVVKDYTDEPDAPKTQPQDLQMEQSDIKTIPMDYEKTTVNNYWFLKILASKKSLHPLCKHPYITAFLDLHYSAVKNGRMQMVDSIPHLALMLLLWHLASTIPGHLHDNFENLLILAAFPCAVVVVLDIISLVGEHTEILDSLLGLSLVKDRKAIGRCTPHLQATRKEKAEHVYGTALYVIGYIISISSLIAGSMFHYYGSDKAKKMSTDARAKDLGINTTSTEHEDHCKQDTGLKEWKKMLECSLIIYPVLLFILEVIQMKSAKLLVDYFGKSKNWIDLGEIIFTFVLGVVSVKVGEDACRYTWLLNSIYLMSLMTFFQLVNDLVHCLPNNDTVHVEHYLHMFYQVAIRYLTILAGFLPFLVAFAACFQAIATEDEPFGGVLFSSGLQTFLMFTGEYNFGDRRFSNTLNKTDVEVLGSDVSYHTKTQIVLAQIIFVAFVFLFAVVVMNLLNAFAIGDIQKLREDAIAIRNHKKVQEIIEQRPEVHTKYYFNNISGYEARPQSDRVLLRSLFDKGYFGDITNPEDSTDGLHFLPHTTFRALKSCTSQADCGPQKNLEEMLQKLLEEIKTIKAELMVLKEQRA